MITPTLYCPSCADDVEPDDGLCPLCESVIDPVGREAALDREEQELADMAVDNWRPRIVIDYAHGTGSYGSESW